MIYYLYQITNKLNGKIYVGVHKTVNLNDGYMGSGKVIKRAIEKHGVGNFEKVILETFDSAEEMYAKEKDVVTDEFLARDDVYNLRRGGHGGFDHINTLSEMTAVRINNASSLPIEHKVRGGKAVWENNREKWEQNPELRNSAFRDSTILQEMRKRAQSDEAKLKRRNTFKEVGHQQGSKNSQFGSCWIYHDLIGNRKCKKDLLPEYIEQGWVKGRIIGV